VTTTHNPTSRADLREKAAQAATSTLNREIPSHLNHRWRGQRGSDRRDHNTRRLVERILVQWGEFGGQLDHFAVFVVSAFEELGENERWAAAQDKLGSYKSPFLDQSLKSLSVGSSIPPAQLVGADLQKGLSIVASALRDKLRSRPKRVPKEFELAGTGFAPCRHLTTPAIRRMFLF